MKSPIIKHRDRWLYDRSQIVRADVDLKIATFRFKRSIDESYIGRFFNGIVFNISNLLSEDSTK